MNFLLGICWFIKAFRLDITRARLDTGDFTFTLFYTIYDFFIISVLFVTSMDAVLVKPVR